MDKNQSLVQALPEYTVENNQLVTYAQKRFYDSDRCKQARKLLQTLVDSPEYNTNPPSFIMGPTPFVERHLNHISKHPRTSLEGYMSNLKLMTSLKRSGPIH